MKPTCPECGSEKMSLVKAGSVWLACDSCDASFIPSRERLIEACLLSHKDAEQSEDGLKQRFNTEKLNVSPEFVSEMSGLLRSLVIRS